jgi:hypothetical protein
VGKGVVPALKTSVARFLPKMATMEPGVIG